MKMETLTKVQSITTSISLVAIPIVLAIVGYFVQDKIASEGLKRDYVQIAVGILKEKKEKDADDASLRRWAIEVLDKNAPVRFTRDAKEVLQKGFPLEWGKIGVYKGQVKVTKDGVIVMPDDSK